MKCVTCNEEVDVLYDCPQCDIDHCVDCRRPQDHSCTPTDSTSDTQGRQTLLGLTLKHWALVIVWWLLFGLGNPEITTVAGLAGAFTGSIVLVWLGVAAYRIVMDSGETERATTQ